MHATRCHIGTLITLVVASLGIAAGSGWSTDGPVVGDRGPASGQRLGQPAQDCNNLSLERFSFDHLLGGLATPAGHVLADQWADVNLRIRAINNMSPLHPDIACAFDSAAPVSGDGDLVTPGTGTDNTEPYGKVLIIAEHANGDRDGTIDFPDDEATGGMLGFEWDHAVIVEAVHLLDVDEVDGARVDLFLDGDQLASIPVAGLDDNSLQLVQPELSSRVDRLEVHLSGSGAVARLDYLPCPRVVNFDETTTGIPLGMGLGDPVVLDMAEQDFHVFCANFGLPTYDHPDEAVLMRGEDLVGPGHPDERNVLVICGSAVDDNGDGVYDTPQPEQAGGTIFLEYQVSQTLHSTRVLNNTSPLSHITLYDIDFVELGTWGLAVAPTQTVHFATTELVRHMEFHFDGPAAIAEVRACPTPGADQPTLPATEGSEYGGLTLWSGR